MVLAPEAITRAEGRPDGQVTFDVHGLVGIDVAPDTPGLAQLQEMLAPFRGPSAAPCRIHAGGRLPATAGGDDEPSFAEDAFDHTDRRVSIPRDRIAVARTADGFAIAGPGELLTGLIPLLDRLCVGQGAAMVHAAMVDYRGAGILLPAWGGVGKTSSVAKLLRQAGVRFMADDWGFVRSDGTLLGYAKPLFLKPHHRAFYPEVFSGVRKPLAPRFLTRSLGHLATTVHPVIVRYPRVAAATRRWSPEHRMLAPESVFGRERIATRAPLTATVFLERYAGETPRLDRRDTTWMAGRVVGNFHSELPTVSRRLVEVLGAAGVVPLPAYFGDKARILGRALARTPCWLLRLPAAWSADEASDHVTGTIESLLDG